MAKLPGYVRPVYHGYVGCKAGNKEFDDGGDGGAGGARGSVDSIVLRGARHPTVERVLEGEFVPNDVELR